MGFFDFFITYKIKRKEVKNVIPFTKLPLYRKIAISVTFAILLLATIFLIFKQNIMAIVVYIIAVILFGIFTLIDSTKRNLSKMLTEHYKPYSEERMNMVLEILKDYKIDFKNRESIDLLIAEAQNRQRNVDYISNLKKPIKVLSAVIIPVIVYAAQRIGEVATLNEIISMTIYIIISILFIFAFIMTLGQIIRYTVLYDYNIYDELISDLTQIKIFYAK